jgi:hypothetical protein
MEYYGSQYFFQQIYKNKRQWLVNIWYSSCMFQSSMAYFRAEVIEIGIVMDTGITDV